MDRPRIVPLQGAYNMRDLGGYPAAGGVLAWGRVFRGATLAGLTSQDQDVLRGLGIHTVCDLRTNQERAHRPSKLPDGAWPARWARDYDMSTANLTSVLMAPGATAEHVRDTMIDLYRSLAYEQAASYAVLFRMISEGRLPLLFHCSAGKDRTGIAAALLLDVVGVARETVIEDYLVTGQFFEQGCAMLRADPHAGRLMAAPADVWRPVMQADRLYLEAMFETIEARHGSARGFLQDVLGLPTADISQLQHALLAD